MWQVTELIPYIGRATQTPAKRIFFSIYYKVDDNAFKRAAQNWAQKVKNRHSFTANDLLLEKEVTTETQFNTAWTEIHTQAVNGGYQVHAGNLLTHASKQTDRGDGLEFIGGTLTHTEIVAMRRLPWTESGFLILSGCNTGLTGERNWAPAHSFALAQRVPTVGQKGYAYFSTSWASYSSIGNNDSNICLWAYLRGKNAALGNGSRIAGNVFRV